MIEKFNTNAKVKTNYQHAGDSCPPNRYRSLGLSLKDFLCDEDI